jgi:hypothetical protein
VLPANGACADARCLFYRFPIVELAVLDKSAG